MACGCQSTPERQAKKALSTLHLHLESGSDRTKSTESVPVYREKPVWVTRAEVPFLSEANVAAASVVDEVGGYSLRIQFDDDGEVLLEECTTRNRGRRIAIFSQFAPELKDYRWLAAPVISRRISDGVLVFTPDATREEARRNRGWPEQRGQEDSHMDRQTMGRKVICGALLLAAAAQAQTFQLPTANQALFEKGGEERYFVGTAGKPWMTGTFGCVRSGGWQMHEGLDIRCLQRDRSGEPADPVLATADGTVAYISTRPSLSNYGNYLILRHLVEGLEIYSLYAHLREIRHDLKVGQPVKAGEAVAVMGRTANTRQSISKDRAHLHFELNLLVNDRFAGWYKKTFPDQRNDHGDWNGQNLLGY